MNRRTVRSLLPWLALVIAAGALGALASREAASFYAQLSRPSWAPPGWIFGPVWTALYLMMGVAAWRVATAPAQRQPGLALFIAQLVANVLWSWLFFAWRLGAAAFADILLLDVLVIATIVAFSRVDKPAAALLLPYLGWIGFATALNWVVWRGNPALLG
jgi:translocator protein